MIALGANNEASIYDSKGVKLLEKKDYSSAKDAFKKAISIDKGDIDAHKGLCKAMEGLYECDELPGCCEELRKLDKSKETRQAITGLLTSQKCYQLTHGSIGYTSGSYEELLKIYNESIATDGGDTEAWNGKGIALGQLNRLNESIVCFDEIIKIKNSPSEVAAAWNNMGVSLDKMDSHSEALEAYNRSIQINRGLAEAWHNKGKTLSLDISLFDAANECDQNALRINPELNGGLGWVYAEFERL